MATTKKTPTKKTPAKKKAAAEKPMTEAEKEAKAAIDAAKAAAKAAEQAKAKAAKEAEKAKAQAEADKEKEKALKLLEDDAKQINGRFATIERNEKRTDDQRLSAALLIAQAKEHARAAKVNFKEWCEAHLVLPPKTEGGEPRRLAYETVRKLIPIGTAEKEKEGAGLLMLEDMRAATAEAMAKHREKKAKEKEQEAKKGPNPDKIREQIANLEPDQVERLLNTEARVNGYKLVKDTESGMHPDDDAGTGTDDSNRLSKEEAEAIEEAKAKPMDRAKNAFGRLKGKGKLEFAHWVASEVGMVLAEEATTE